MATTTNVRCDFCKKITTSEDRKMENVNGFTAEIGYSTGGWGRRKDLVPAMTVEICDDCFKAATAAANTFKEKIDFLKAKKNL